MSQALFQLSVAGFLLLPPLVLWLRFCGSRRLPWWGVFLLLAAGGWLFANAAVYFYYEHLGALVADNPDAPPELLERWVGDGAKRVFALFFGWLHGLVYAIPFLLVYALATRARHARSGAEEGTDR